MVFAPAPQLTVTVEQRGDEPDIHVHAGGQGVWQARMVRSLGIRVVFCAAFGGETGQIARHLIAGEGIEVCGVDAQSRSGAYVQDRRGGERVDIAEVVGDPLTRHELDELYGIALTEGLRARVAVLSGLRVVKVSQDQLVADGRIDGAGVDALVGAMCRLRDEGAATVLVTRAEQPALALIGDEAVEVVTPQLEPADPREAGASTTAGIAASLGQGEGVADAIRTGD